ncbi:MAG: hypothetical protein ACEPOV_05250 [Hyphomicrobiales bacterium]
MKKLIIIFSFCFIGLFINAQESTNYYKLLREAEHYIVDSDLQAAVNTYDNAFETYNYPFAKDLTAGAFVAHYANDTTKLYKYIAILLKRGMSLRELKKFVERRPNDKRILQFENNFLTYQEIYLNSIDYEMEKKFRDLDKRNQVDISYIRLNFKDKDKSKKERAKADSLLVNKYVLLVNKYGFPIEDKLGLGSHIFIKMSDEEKNTFHKCINYEFIKEPDIRKLPKDSVWFGYSYIKNTSLTKINLRRGNSFLWHVNLKRHRNLDALLKEAIKDLKVYPDFYLSCKERSGEDYYMGWESKVKQKYGFDLKKIIKKDPQAVHKINKRRQEYNLRTLEEDLLLFYAIQQLEGEAYKYKHVFSRKMKTNSLFLNSLFTFMFP